MEDETAKKLGTVSAAIAEALSRFLENELSAIDSDDWWKNLVVGKLRFEQRRRLEREGVSSLSHLDLLALLRVLESNGDAFGDETAIEIASAERIKAIRDVCNAVTYADVSPISEEDGVRHFGSLSLFLGRLEVCGYPVDLPDRADLLPQTLPEKSDLAMNEFVIHPAEGTESRSDLVTLSGVKSDAQVTVWPVSGPEGERFLIHDIAFENGERHVRCGSRCDSPEQWDRLVGRLRQGVYETDDGRFRMDLRQARWKDNGWSNRFQATRSQLEKGAGLDVFEFLQGWDAVECGTRGEVLGETGRKRNETCVVFSGEERIVPIVAYVATTLLPLRNGMKTSK